MDIHEFDSIFHNSTYRIVHKQFETANNPEGKNPVNNLVYDLDDALQEIENRGGGYRLGWMVDSEHIVVDVDCDHEHDQERDKAKRVFSVIHALGIKCFVYTTQHGMHCIFKRGDYEARSVTKVMCGLGVKVDYRVKGSYVILPHNDPNRRWWNGTSREIDVIPHFFKVITKSRSVEELWGLAEHDGRNDAMFTFLNVLKRSQMIHLTSEQIKEDIELINRYILREPMSDRELYSTILRPENLVVNNNRNQSSVISDYAELIASENSIIHTLGSFFMIMDETKIYRQMTDDDMDRFIYKNYTKGLSSKNRKEIIIDLSHETETPWEECNRDKYDVPFLNGIYNVRDGSFRPTLESDYITYVIPHVYKEDAQPTMLSEAFYGVSLEHSLVKRLFFDKMLGYSMTRSAEFQVFFVFHGDGGTGKSTMLNILTKIVGSENIANLQLADFEKNFGLEALFNKLINLGDDISTTHLTDSQSFKKASSGDLINVDRKHRSAITFRPFAKIIFTCNGFPKIQDKSRAMGRRMRLIGSNHVITPEERIPDFENRWQEEDYQAIISEALHAFHLMLDNGETVFPDPDESVGSKERMRLISEHTYAFVKATYPDISPKEALDGHRVVSEYQAYRLFCQARGYNVSSLDTFTEQIGNNLEYNVENVQQLDGISQECFIPRRKNKENRS